MINVKVLRSTALCAALLLAGCGGGDDDSSAADTGKKAGEQTTTTTTTTTVAVAQTKTEKDPVTGVSITFPKDWSPTTISGVYAVHIDPSDAKDFRRNINVTKQAYNGTTEAYKAALEGQVKQVPGSKTISSDTITIAGNVSANRIIWEGKAASDNLRYMTVAAVKGGNAYVLTYTSMPGNFDGKRKDVDAVVATMTLP